jgi:hypothetical protein
MSPSPKSKVCGGETLGFGVLALWTTFRAWRWSASSLTMLEKLQVHLSGFPF